MMKDRERERAKRRERKMRTSEWANTRARGGCCCCGRGITSAPLTRKTFRLNLVLDSARLLSTHPNRTAFLARPKRSANPFPPYSPILYKCYQTAVGPPPNRRRSVCRVYLTPFRSYQHKQWHCKRSWSSVQAWGCFMLAAINATIQPRTPMFPLLSPFPSFFPSLSTSFPLVLQLIGTTCYAGQREPEPGGPEITMHAAGRTFSSFRVALPSRQEEITFAKVLSTAAVEVDSRSNLSCRGFIVAETFSNRQSEQTYS